MTERDTGGRAFPWCGDLNECPTMNLGMTLRDYFAAKAMLIGGPANQPPAYDNETRAKYAYEMADAMLKARDA